MACENKSNRLVPASRSWGVCSLLVALLTTSLSLKGQAVNPRSPLVLGIVVEGLSDEYLSLLEPQLLDNGFKRLIRDGAALSNVEFGPGIDPTAAAAMIYTGAAPSVNGIPARLIYNTDTRLATPVLLDKAVMGNFTDETLSADPLKVSTLADEIRIDSDGDGMVYSLAADPSIAIITAGHAANGACWITDHTGNWATTTYYRDMPKALSERNYRNPIHSRLDTLKWTPMMPMAFYPLLSESEQATPFRINFPSKDINRYRKYKVTPPANTEVTDMAIELINTAQLGRDSRTDMLNVAYNLQPAGASRAEVLDAYLRLDRDLSRLFSAADHAAGSGRTTIFLSGLPSNSGVAPDHDKWRIPHGEFSVKRATYLLEMYLIALHGNADWVVGYHDKQLFLNRKIITDKGFSLADFRSEVADFMARMSGVSGVYTIDDIIASRAGDNPQATKRNTSVSHCGDIIIEINPGWEIIDDDTSASPSRRAVERASAQRIPAFIAGPQISPVKIDAPVDARALAPAVARVLRIRSPNAAANNELSIN